MLFRVIYLSLPENFPQPRHLDKALVLNLLRWNDVPRTSRICRLKIAIFSQFYIQI